MSYVKKEGLEEQKIDGETVLFDVDSFKFYEFNETMSLIWKHIDSKSVDEIAELIMKEFEVNKETAIKDVNKSISELESANLILQQ